MKQFNYAVASRSRLMGSYGLEIGWNIQEKRDFTQYFLIDAEEEGLTDYTSLGNVSALEKERASNRLMGALGSERTQLSLAQACNLLYQAASLNIRRNRPFPGDYETYKDLLRRDITVDERALFYQICTLPKEAVEFVNYMVMRLVASDQVALRAFAIDKAHLWPVVARRGACLLATDVTERSQRSYFVSALYQEEQGYVRQGFGISIEPWPEFALRSVLVGQKTVVSQEEVNRTLGRQEYLGVFTKPADFDGQALLERLPMLYAVDFPSGQMLSWFMPQNDHVKKKRYRIHEDLLAVFYITSQQVLVSGLMPERYDQALECLQSLLSAQPALEFLFPSPMLYDFAKSDLQRFEEYLKNTMH